MIIMNVLMDHIIVLLIIININMNGFQQHSKMIKVVKKIQIQIQNLSENPAKSWKKNWSNNLKKIAETGINNHKYCTNTNCKQCWHYIWWYHFVIIEYNWYQNFCMKHDIWYIHWYNEWYIQHDIFYNCSKCFLYMMLHPLDRSMMIKCIYDEINRFSARRAIIS